MEKLSRPVTLNVVKFTSFFVLFFAILFVPYHSASAVFLRNTGDADEFIEGEGIGDFGPGNGFGFGPGGDGEAGYYSPAGGGPVNIPDTDSEQDKKRKIAEIFQISNANVGDSYTAQFDGTFEGEDGTKIVFEQGDVLQETGDQFNPTNLSVNDVTESANEDIENDVFNVENEENGVDVKKVIDVNFGNQQSVKNGVNAMRFVIDVDNAGVEFGDEVLVIISHDNGETFSQGSLAPTTTTPCDENGNSTETAVPATVESLDGRLVVIGYTCRYSLIAVTVPAEEVAEEETVDVSENDTDEQKNEKLANIFNVDVGNIETEANDFTVNADGSFIGTDGSKIVFDAGDTFTKIDDQFTPANITIEDVSDDLPDEEVVNIDNNSAGVNIEKILNINFGNTAGVKVDNPVEITLDVTDTNLENGDTVNIAVSHNDGFTFSRDSLAENEDTVCNDNGSAETTKSSATVETVNERKIVKIFTCRFSFFALTSPTPPVNVLSTDSQEDKRLKIFDIFDIVSDTPNATFQVDKEGSIQGADGTKVNLKRGDILEQTGDNFNPANAFVSDATGLAGSSIDTEKLNIDNNANGVDVKKIVDVDFGNVNSAKSSDGQPIQIVVDVEGQGLDFGDEVQVVVSHDGGETFNRDSLAEAAVTNCDANGNADQIMSNTTVESLDGRLVVILYTCRFSLFGIVVPAEVIVNNNNNNNNGGGGNRGGGGGGGSLRPNTTSVFDVTLSQPTGTSLNLVRPIRVKETEGKIVRPIHLENFDEKHKISFTQDTQISFKSTGENFTGKISPPKKRKIDTTFSIGEGAEVLALVEIPKDTEEELVLSQPYELKIFHNMSEHDRENIEIYYYNKETGTYELEENSKLDSSMRSITLTTNHMSVFAVIDTQGNPLQKIRIENSKIEEELTESNEIESRKELENENANLETNGAQFDAIFSDIDGHWAEKFIMTLHSRGVVNGKTQTQFSPDDQLTRAELLKIALNTFRSDVDVSDNTSIDFSDVSSDAWYAPYVVYAQENNIINGYKDGTFRPNAPVNRAEALKILLVASNIEVQNEIANFTDVEKNAWYEKYITFAAKNDIVSGFSDNTFKPQSFITRSEIAKIAVKTSDLYSEIAKK